MGRRPGALSLVGAHVLITGASRGIGLELARVAAARGARVSLVARPSAALDAVAREVGGAAVPADLSDLGQAAGVPAAAAAVHGPVDVLVNNAAKMGMGPLARLDAETLRATLTVNLLAPAELSRACSAAMVDRGARGAIVNVSSLAGELALRNVPAYGTSKAGLAYLTRALQRELRGTGVRAQLVVLGGVDTELLRENEADPVAGPSSQRLKSVVPVPGPGHVAQRIADHVERRRRRPLVIPSAAFGVVALRAAPTLVADLALLGMPRSL
jgi:short-subunit dehydrogenase